MDFKTCKCGIRTTHPSGICTTCSNNEYLSREVSGRYVMIDILKMPSDLIERVEKFKVSSHETDLQGANSGQLQQHNVIPSLPPAITELIEWLNVECCPGTSVYELKHDFVECLRLRLDDIPSGNEA